MEIIDPKKKVEERYEDFDGTPVSITTEPDGTEKVVPMLTEGEQKTLEEAASLARNKKTGK